MPAGSDRAVLESRRLELRAGLTKSDPGEIVKRVARLFLRFPSSRLPDDVAKATMASYAQDLQHFPLWAIDEACMSIISGQEDMSKAFVPSSLQLRDACKRALNRVHQEIADLSQVLDAEVYHEPTAEERARNMKMFDDLVAELRLRGDPRESRQDRPPTRDEAQGALDRALANPVSPPQFSSALRDKLGIQPQREQGEAA